MIQEQAILPPFPSFSLSQILDRAVGAKPKQTTKTETKIPPPLSIKLGSMELGGPIPQQQSWSVNSKGWLES